MSIYRKGERLTPPDGTLNYNNLTNIPKVNGTEIKGNVNLSAGCILEVDTLPLDNIDQTKLYKQGNVISWWNGTTWLNVSGSASTSSTLGQDLMPVGSIFISYSSISPAGVFGGQWVQIKDCFLVGKGALYNEDYVVGGKSKTITPSGTNSEPSITLNSVTLTTENIPSHTHNLTVSGTVTCTEAATFTGTQNSTISAKETYTVTDPGHKHSYTYMLTNKSGTDTKTCMSSWENHAGSWSHSLSSTTPSVSVKDSTTHSHTYTAKGTISGGAFTFTGTPRNTDANGSGTPFTPTMESATAPTFVGTPSDVEILPPYLVVYVWKRIS